MQSDQDLLARITAGDAAAFEELYERYSDSVRRHLVRAIRDEDSADDLVQEVFLKVWTRAEQWEGRGSFRGWLFGIATNTALNLLRTLRRRKEQPINALLESMAEDSESPAPGWMIDDSAFQPEVALDRSFRYQQLRQLVEGLSEEKREVIRLVHETELTIAETAEALGIPAGTVKSRLHYAAKSLTREWEKIDTETEE